MSDAESFEVQGVPYDQLEDAVSLIAQITEDIVSTHPGYGIRVKFNGNQAIVTYHCWEISLPSRVKDVEHTADTFLNSYVKELKKQYKDQSGHTLKFKEIKDMRSISSEKVSLNDRYYFKSTRIFEF